MLRFFIHYGIHFIVPISVGILFFKEHQKRAILILLSAIIIDLDRNEEGGYIADAKWTVRGSVNHFGHTHYRQNQYRALVSFIIDNGNWKINNIEILDARRLY